MTSYLLIDLDKSAVGCVAPTGDTSHVFLFAKKKNNRQIAQDFAAENPQVVFVKVGKEENVAKVLGKHLKKLLKKHSDARFLIDSPRGKVMKAVDKLLNRFPDANVVMLDMVSADDADVPAQTDENKDNTAEKAVSPSASAPSLAPKIAPENIKLAQPQANKPPKNPPSKKKIPVSKKPSLLPENKPDNLCDTLEKSTLFKKHILLDKVSQNHDKNDKSAEDLPIFDVMMSRLNDVIGVLTQGFPKKKDVLLQEIAQALGVDTQEAQMVLDNLLSNGMMKMENNNLVKITNLIHLLKLKC